jgi:hypothetical protein
MIKFSPMSHILLQSKKKSGKNLSTEILKMGKKLGKKFGQKFS